MPTPLEEHGGIDPGAAFPKLLADTINKVILILKPKDSINPYKLFEGLLMSHVANIFIRTNFSTNDKINLPDIHPLVGFLPKDADIGRLCIEAVNHLQCGIFVYEMQADEPVPEELWSVLRSAKEGQSVSFIANGKTHALFAVTSLGITPVEKECIPFPMTRKSILSEITIDVSNCFTDLCALATKYATDKTPYNVMTHRHPYTAIYDMFLAPRTTKKLGEIGILNGASVRMWREYLPEAELVGFDINEKCMNHMKEIPNSKGILVDSGNSKGLKDALQVACSDGKKFDVLIEDASHRPEHQLVFLRDAIEFMAPGGLMIIEDIFRAVPAVRFEEVLRGHGDKIAKAILIRPEHIFRFSPNWENDRLLFVWVR